jgi:hypothetical protein
MEYTSSFLLQFMLAEHHLRHGISRHGEEVSLSVTSSTSTQTKYCRLRRNHSGISHVMLLKSSSLTEAMSVKIVLYNVLLMDGGIFMAPEMKNQLH